MSKPVPVPSVSTAPATIAAALLTALCLPGFLNCLESARVPSAVKQINNFRISLEGYREQCGDYPTQEQGLSALLVNSPSFEKCPGDHRETAIPLTRLPVDSWGRPYHYVKNSLGYELWSDRLNEVVRHPLPGSTRQPSAGAISRAQPFPDSPKLNPQKKILSSG